RGAVDARTGALGFLPAVQQRAQLLARRAPLHLARVGRRDLLGGLHDAGAGGHGLGLGGGPRLLQRGTALGGAATQRLDPGPEAVQVTDGGRLGRLVAELLERLVDLPDREVRAVEAGLEQTD